MLARLSVVSRATGTAAMAKLPLRTAPTLSLYPPADQQKRSAWTKARKKRQARYERRQAMAKAGIEVPKPPNYIPPDTPVIGSVDKAARMAEIKAHDEIVTAELHAKLAAAHEKPVLRYQMTGLRMSDRVRKLFDLHNGNQMEVVKAQKQKGMEVFQRHDGDTGSSAVQVIALTTRIQQMQVHMSKHKKDNHNKRGMDRMFVRRRKLLDYMERREFDEYRRVVKTLGLVR
jgi:small subunit ribosomal protein S15